MSGIPTNPSAITALQASRVTQHSLNNAQRWIWIRLKTGGAADSASSRAIAEAMKSDEGVLSFLGDSPTESASILNVAQAAIARAVKAINDIELAVAQTRQQLGVQSVVIANRSAKSIVKHSSNRRCIA